jgi:hypothetical protein
MVEWSLRFALACSLAMLAVLMVWVWGDTRAWAAAPEAPETKPAVEVLNTTAKLVGVVNPKASATVSWFFQYNEGSSCTGAGAGTTPVGGPEEVEARSVEAGVSGLKPGTQYTFCLVARNEAEEVALGNEVSFTTTAVKPLIDKQSVTGVVATEATLSASINAEGSPTSYWVEYGTSEAYGSESSHVGIGAPVGDVGEVARLSGLAPGTTYHFRFVASNTLGTTFGGDVSFTTPAAGEGTGGTAGCPNSTFLGFSAALPDCRAYELVSSATQPGDAYVPAGQENVGVGFLGEAQFYTKLPFRSAAGGEALAFVGDPGPVGGNGSIGKGSGNEYLATRGPDAGPQGWQVADITPAFTEGEVAGESVYNEFEVFSDDLSTSILHSDRPLGSVPAPEPQGPAGCGVLYSRTGDGRFHALFSRTLTPGFCGVVRQKGATGESPLFFAGSPAEDPSQMLFQTPAALVAPAVATVGEGWNLYDSVGGALSVVNVLPEGGPAANATFGGPRTYEQGLPDLSRAVARDGSRIVFSTLEELSGSGAAFLEPKALFVRENPSRPQSPIGKGGECTIPTDACTVQLDVPQAGASGASGSGRFWAASADGSKVLFSDCRRLTEASTAISEEGCQHVRNESEPVLTGADLYEYDFSKPVGERLTDLTVQENPGNLLGADVQGVLGASEDGSWVYFVAAGALAPGSGPRKCETSSEEEGREELKGHLPAGKGCNLYVSHRIGSGWEAPRFIAALAARDSTQISIRSGGEGIGDWAPGLGSRTAQVSTDGRHLVFESTQQITGYDNSSLQQGGSGGSPHATAEVFVYDADAGRLSCVSCDPTGAPPQPPTEIPGNGFSPETTGGGYLPWSSNNFVPRWMNAAASEVFFDSSQPLVAQDTNGVQDVYEWEREGTGSCSARTPARFDGGCVFLLSGGQSPDVSYLLDADEGGKNVFITHRGPLGSAGPADDKVHVYDVRVEGGFPGGALACTGTGCQGVPLAPPAFATPSSVTFSGLGNFSPQPPGKPKVETRARKLAKALKDCRRKHNRHKRVACERQARARYGTVKSKAGKRSGKGRR